QQFHVIYSAGGLMTYLNISISWQFAITLFIRMQCGCCNFAALFYRHQMVQLAGSKFKFSPWKCTVLAVIYYVFIDTIFIPMNLLSAFQGSWKDIVRREFLPQGAWL
ncbi:hypothetical protein PFISCL1PPCAC_842, partial [Pristionchus fissidentatus]